MRVADIADDLGAYHAVADIPFLKHVVGVERFEVAGPTAAGIELGVGFE